jgi:hypothetical protein
LPFERNLQRYTPDVLYGSKFVRDLYDKAVGGCTS